MLVLNEKSKGGGGLSTQSVVETVTALVKPILDDHHFYLTDVEFVKEGGGWYLRVYIDKTGGITLDECVMVSEALSEKLRCHGSRSNPAAIFP